MSALLKDHVDSYLNDSVLASRRDIPVEGCFDTSAAAPPGVLTILIEDAPLILYKLHGELRGQDERDPQIKDFFREIYAATLRKCKPKVMSKLRSKGLILNQ